ncbi:MAG: hypothetical protein R2755_22585 [Acidimicrobiales bacterium]
MLPITVDGPGGGRHRGPSLGADYAGATASLRLLSLMFVLTYLASIGSSVLLALGRSWPVTLVSLTTVVLNTAANLLPLPWAVDRMGPGGPKRSGLGHGVRRRGGGCGGAVVAGRSAVGRSFAAGHRGPGGGGRRGPAGRAPVSGLDGLPLLALEAALALATVGLGARRPIRALRSGGDTQRRQAAEDERAAADKEQIVGNRQS